MAAERRYAQIHEDRPFHDGTEKRWSKTSGPSFPYHFQDGVTIYVSETDLNPKDKFLKAGPGVGDLSVEGGSATSTA
jgi:hypothetical protein